MLYVYGLHFFEYSIGCFFFFIFKKLKFQKYMSVLKNFENIPRSPAPGATGSCRPSNGRHDLNVNFFEFAKRSLAGGVWREGVMSPPTGDRRSPTLYKPWPPFPSHLSSKIAPKNQKKREG